MTSDSGRNGFVSVPPDVILQEIGDEIVVANLDSGVYFALNEVAARTWALLRDAPDLDAVVAALLDEYEIDESTVRGDLDTLLKQLAEYGLMHINHA